MTVALYHYVHCPFCVRVRMALGYLQIPWTSHVVSYDDEETPVRLSGKKMLPILTVDGKAHNESLDIIALLDRDDRLQNKSWGDLTIVLNQLGELVHSLAMPYWVWSPEFNAESRNYFMQKKSVKRGPFNDLAKRRSEFETPLLKMLDDLESNIQPYWQSKQLTIRDIGIAAHLWGLFVVPEFRFSQPWHDYLMRVKEECRFSYHADFWKTT